MSFNKYLKISQEVQSALDEKKTVVALESTIISHGMPYPQNYETAKKVEDKVREYGAVPATIAILDGLIKVGLTEDDLLKLSGEGNILKASRRDIPVIVSEKLNAATTVSATMICAAMAGLKIFATGGIGGVHRKGNESFDISADLTELAQTNIAVVSAGVKSILDIGLTLEYLETLGVPVLGYGTNEFPAFYTRQSGFKVNYRLDTPGQIGSMIKTKWGLGLNGGVIVANPIPEEFSMDKKIIDEAIENALKKADEKNVKGKDVTPFLLGEIKNITGGSSLDSNIKLVLNNAKLAAEISQFL
ncbi:MAG: pseudouridine-5'-phosphate glycosidase [Ignavibacteria bacterium]|nr:pseudouridine-5'-phosphate glycosidase [Ignavibacteria bacterium]